MPLTNRRQTRRYILAQAARLRPGWRFERVSEAALDNCEAVLRDYINRQVRRLPSVGKTVRFD